MKRIQFILMSLLSTGLLAQSYAPAAGQEGSTAIAYDSELFVAWANGAEIERGLVDISNPEAQDQGSNYASYGIADDALGIADGTIVSLGDRGTAILTFEKPIGNGSGFDFAVFENSFSDTFLELAFVEVSSDGINFFRFPAHSETQTETQVGGFGLIDPTYINNFAGKYRAMFGTPFDLDDLEDNVLLDKNNITHVKLIDVVGSIDPKFASYDSLGNAVNDPFPTPFGSGGFDLDAVGVINEATMNVEDLSVQNFKIYPNPADKFFYISTNEKVQVEIFNAAGQTVLQTQSQNNNKINVSGLSNGIYFIKINCKGKTSLHKLIKQ